MRTLDGQVHHRGHADAETPGTSTQEAWHVTISLTDASPAGMMVLFRSPNAIQQFGQVIVSFLDDASSRLSLTARF